MKIDTAEYIPLAEAVELLGITPQSLYELEVSGKVQTISPWRRPKLYNVRTLILHKMDRAKETT